MTTPTDPYAVDLAWSERLLRDKALGHATRLYAALDFDDDAEVLRAAEQFARWIDTGELPKPAAEVDEGAALDAPQVVIRRTDSGPRTIEILVDGHSVGATSYDEGGWSGMDAMERVAVAVAEACGATVRREEPAA